MANTTTSKAPTHEIFHVVGEKDKSRWTKIGVGWQNDDSDNLSLVINYSPLLAGRTIVRKIKAQETEE